MTWELPVTVEVAGKAWPIRSDFRAVLDAIAALNDAELPAEARAVACAQILYPDWAQLLQQAPDEALAAAMTFVNCGEPVPENQPPKPQLVRWDKDVQLIAPAVDAVLGRSCRASAYLHWWEFVGAFDNIGRGLFAQVVAIRSKRIRGQKLDAAEKRFLRENPDLIGPKTQATPEEEAFFRKLGL